MISIYPDWPVKFDGLEDDPQIGVAYHFDAILRYSADHRARYTSYPVEFGADVQDHAYNEPDKLIIFGSVGSRELRLSFNNLPAIGAIGAQAIIGRINNPVLSAGSGIFAASAGYLSGSDKTRGGATYKFLTDLKEGFKTFTAITGLKKFPNLKIDRLFIPVDENNESGLDFIVELSQLRFVGEELKAGNTAPNLSNDDPAKNMASPNIDRGRIALG